MKNYTYVSVTGEKTEVEVTDEMFEILKSEDRAEHANDVKETRRHYHWEAMDYEGKDWMDIENRARITDPERWKAEMILMIPEAIEKLPSYQKMIAKKVLLEKKSPEDAASDLGISPRSVYRNLEEIYPKLEKTLTTF
ncbi:MAG: sigma-70 family RNA polymerase sigma factor [Clostridia bacterium]|nr:sigma-70 family RNA polymerase sigma factor [Clostridia bacterium]